MVRTRWMVASMVIAVALIAGVGYSNELARSDAGLADLGAGQASVAAAAALALGTLAPTADPRAAATAGGLAALESASTRVMLISPAGDVIERLDGTHLEVPGLAAAVAHGERVFRVERGDAAQLGLPARTAMVGLARAGAWTIAVAASAERQRDRDREGQLRLVLSMVLAAGLVFGFGFVALRKQRAQLELAHALAVAEAARARDAELERLSRAATMAAIASGVAHELSTPLGVIVGRAEQVLARAVGDDRTARAAQTIIEQADHIDRVVRGLLGLARGAPIALVAVEPAALVADAAALVEHRFARAGVTLAISIAAAPPAIRGEPLLLTHALVNLLLNACDASPAGATVALAVTADAAEVALTVTDDGVGITAAAAARAHEPFFTTKPAGQGTGLGLAIAHEIASTHRGSLAIAPRTPRGTLACIRIPIDLATDMPALAATGTRG